MCARERASERESRWKSSAVRGNGASQTCVREMTNALYRILWLVHWPEHKNYAKLTGKFMMLVAMLQPNGLAT